ncbi:MAG: tail fiber assembly protein [Ewingella sp.]
MVQAVLNKAQIATVAGDITVFNYDNVTHEYLSSSVELLPVGVGVPANACTDAPGERKPGFALCRKADASGWEYVADHRGEPVYSTENGKSQAVMALGHYPEGTTVVKPASPFDQWDGERWVTDSVAQEAAAVTVAENEKRRLQSEAERIISPLSTAVKYQMATEAEAITLADWEKYTVLLSRVDTRLAPAIKWPKTPA